MTICTHCGREIVPFGDGEWKDEGTTDAARVVRCYDEADNIPTDVPSDQRHEPEAATVERGQFIARGLNELADIVSGPLWVRRYDEARRAEALDVTA